MSANTSPFSFQPDDASDETIAKSDVPPVDASETSKPSEAESVVNTEVNSDDPFSFDLGDFGAPEALAEEPVDEPVLDTGSWMEDEDETPSEAAEKNSSEQLNTAEAPVEEFAVAENEIGDFDFSNAEFPAPTEQIRSEEIPAEQIRSEESSAEAEEVLADEAVVAVPVSAVSAPAAPVSGGDEIEVARVPRLLNPMGRPVERARVALLGASGIGKNHARWFVRYGCEIVSFLGSSEESIETTRSQLKNSFDFEGESFTDLETLLRESKPEIVCVATPAPLHFAHTLAALEADCHVLCEKPLVYAPARSPRENRDGARELVTVARQKGKVLGTQLQYAAATPILCKLADTVPTEVSDCAMEIETSNEVAPRSARELWMDLGPHPLSIVQYLGGPDAKLEEDMMQFQTREEGDFVEVVTRFAVRSGDGRLITARAVVRRFDGTRENRPPRRRIALNGRVISYSGFTGTDGVYKAEFASPDGYISHYRDPVDFLIGNFLAACEGREQLIVDGEFGAKNLDWLLTLAR